MYAPNDVHARERVADIVREILERRSIARTVSADEDLRDAGLNSLDMVNLMLAVEAEFELEIPDADMALRNFRTIAAIEAMLTTLTAENRGRRAGHQGAMNGTTIRT